MWVPILDLPYFSCVLCTLFDLNESLFPCFINKDGKNNLKPSLRLVVSITYVKVASMVIGIW